MNWDLTGKGKCLCCEPMEKKKDIDGIIHITQKGADELKKFKCITCNGKGKIEYTDPLSAEFYWEDCLVCSGKGYYNDRM